MLAPPALPEWSLKLLFEKIMAVHLHVHSLLQVEIHKMRVKLFSLQVETAPSCGQALSHINVDVICIICPSNVIKTSSTA